MTHVLDRIAESGVCDQLASELEKYTWALAHSILVGRAQTEKEDAVQFSILQLLESIQSLQRRKEPVTKPYLHSVLKQSLSRYFDDSRSGRHHTHISADDHCTRDIDGNTLHAAESHGNQVLAEGGFRAATGNENHGPMIVEMLDECTSAAERNFVLSIVRDGMDIFSAGKLSGLSRDQIESLARRILGNDICDAQIRRSGRRSRFA